VDVPVVYVYGESDQAGDVVHMPDDAGGIGLAVDHLVTAGRRRIVHLTGPGHTTAVARRVGGLSARLRRHGLELAAPVGYGEWSQRWARAAATHLLREVPDVDAVLCGSGQIASGVLVAWTSGSTVPDGDG
jgi:LacI family transcriptional regulator